MPNPRTFLKDVTPEMMEADPHPTLRRMREECPVAWWDAIGMWIVASWDLCQEVGTDSARFEATALSEEFFGPSVLSARGERHADLRSGIDPLLRPKPIRETTATLIRPVAQRYVAAVKPLGQIDASAELLELASVRVIGDMLGIDDIDDERRQRWFHSLAGTISTIVDHDAERIADETRHEVDNELRARIAKVTVEPDSTLLSSFVHGGREPGNPRSFDEVIGSIRVLVTGGFQEPGHGAAAGLLGLLRNPDQLEAVRQEPDSLMPQVVDEGLRWISPFTTTERIAMTDTEVGGVPIAEGDLVLVSMGSANRDASRWENPDAFDIFRPKKPHAAFGFGSRLCAGHVVGRSFDVEAIRETVVQLPGLRIAPGADPQPTGFFMRGVKHLPVVWDV